jgi:hypothetical protein
MRYSCALLRALQQAAVRAAALHISRACALAGVAPILKLAAID